MPSLKIRNPTYRQVIRASVVRVDRLTPHFVNVTLTSEDMGKFDYLGFDQAVRLFFPRPGQDELRLPTASGNGWIAKFYLIPTAARPFVRNYTIRAYRPETREVDIEFVVHGDDSPASYWATRARPGDEAGLFPEGIQYLPSKAADWQLIVGDESATPAILSILEHAPADLRAKVFLELPDTADIRATPDRPDVHISWLPRDGRGGIPGQLVLETLRGADLPGGSPYVFIAGESGLATGLRRHLVADRGIVRSDITFVGYWKRGRSASSGDRSSSRPTEGTR